MQLLQSRPPRKRPLLREVRTLAGCSRDRCGSYQEQYTAAAILGARRRHTTGKLATLQQFSRAEQRACLVSKHTSAGNATATSGC